MRIGVDARALAVPAAGIAVYSRCVLKGFAALARGHRFFLYSTRDFALPCPGPFVKRLGTGPLALKGSAWMQAAVPGLCRRDRIDLFWSPLQTLPAALPRSIPAVLTIHDFVQLLFPGSMTLANRLILKTLAPLSWRRADAFLTGSRYSEGLIRRFLGRDRDVRAVPYGPLEVERRPSREEGAAFVRSSLGVEAPYLLAVGTLEPRKNLAALARAVGILASRPGAPVPPLVVAGAKGWKFGEVFETVKRLGLERRIVFAGRVSDDDLARLYAGADLFVFPSLYEGFGLPVLEAMSMGVPVACSRSSSLPELVGDAGLLFDPRDPEDIASAIRRAFSEGGLRDRLARAGRERAAAYSWERTARGSLDFLEAVASRRRPPRRTPPLPPVAGEAAHFDRASRELLEGATAEDRIVREPTSFESSMARDAFAFLGELRGSRFLDFGCGHGHNAIFAAKSGARAGAGFDVSRGAIGAARAKAEANGVAGNAFFLVARAERLPFRGGAFDRVAGNGILHHVAPGRAAEEVRRVLAPGGRAAFMEPLGDNPLAQAVRAWVPYSRKGRTARERPLKRREIRGILSLFPHAEAREYYLLTALLRLFRGWFPRGPIDEWDRRLLGAFPFLRPLAAQALILLEREGRGEGRGGTAGGGSDYSGELVSSRASSSNFATPSSGAQRRM
jgi:glycosyltransferase involved in cell wall biosynthesis